MWPEKETQKDEADRGSGVRDANGKKQMLVLFRHSRIILVKMKVESP